MYLIIEKPDRQHGYVYTFWALGRKRKMIHRITSRKPLPYDEIKRILSERVGVNGVKIRNSGVEYRDLKVYMFFR